MLENSGKQVPAKVSFYSFMLVQRRPVDKHKTQKHCDFAAAGAKILTLGYLLGGGRVKQRKIGASTTELGNSETKMSIREFGKT